MGGDHNKVLLMPTCGERGREARLCHIKQGYATGSRPERNISPASPPVEMLMERQCQGVCMCVCLYERIQGHEGGDIHLTLYYSVWSTVWSESDATENIRKLFISIKMMLMCLATSQHWLFPWWYVWSVTPFNHSSSFTWHGDVRSSGSPIKCNWYDNGRTL